MSDEKENKKSEKINKQGLWENVGLKPNLRTSGLLRNNLQDKEVEFKLWKQKPSNIYSKADFTYKIIFQVSYKDKNSFVDNVVKGDTAKGIYYKILNKIKPNYFSYKMKKY